MLSRASLRVVATFPFGRRQRSLLVVDAQEGHFHEQLMNRDTEVAPAGPLAMSRHPGSQSGAGRSFSRRNVGLNSFDW